MLRLDVEVIGSNPGKIKCLGITPKPEDLFSPLSTKKVACVYKPSIDHFFPKELERKIVLFRRKLAAAAAVAI